MVRSDFEGRLALELLNRKHNRDTFSCGIEFLDRYLKRQANQDSKRRISRVFVACGSQEGSQEGFQETEVLGYYTLSTFALDLSALPEKIAKRLPRHPVLAALIGRLAVNTSMQGQGVGGLLLANAIRRTLAVSDEIAIFALVVDAIDDKAEVFYSHYGFSRLAASGTRLFLPLKSSQ